jgi:hypothetical protein
VHIATASPITSSSFPTEKTTFQHDKESERTMTDKSDPLLSQWGKPKNLRVTTAESSLFGGDYTWPNIFDEANEMLFASILIYALADLRTLARQVLLPIWSKF